MDLVTAATLHFAVMINVADDPMPVFSSPADSQTSDAVGTAMQCHRYTASGNKWRCTPLTYSISGKNRPG